MELHAAPERVPIEPDAAGVMRVGGTRVTLDTADKLTGGTLRPYADLIMELHVPPELEAKLNRLAETTGRTAEQLALDLLATSVEHDEWFRREVNRGRASARAGRLLDSHELISRIAQRGEMSVTFYPKGLLITAVFLVMFGATLALAIEVRQAAAMAGALALAAYLFVEFFVVFNPAFWWREPRNGHK